MMRSGSHPYAGSGSVRAAMSLLASFDGFLLMLAEEKGVRIVRSG